MGAKLTGLSKWCDKLGWINLAWNTLNNQGTISFSRTLLHGSYGVTWTSRPVARPWTKWVQRLPLRVRMD